MSSRADIFFLPPLKEPGVFPCGILPWQRWGEGGGMCSVKDSLVSKNHLVLADNLDLLNFLPDNFIDLCYIDPPFSTGRRKESPHGEDGPEGFDDKFEGISDFIDWLSPRLTGLWRILKDNGNLVIHLDTRAVHHVRIFCDSIFGERHWENEIIWHYTGGGRSKNRFSRKHDVLLWYSKGPGRVFNIDEIREPYAEGSGYARSGIVSKSGKKYMPHPDGTPVDDVWDIPMVNPMADERTGYPTQKPLKLLERIIAALSEPNSIVCDIFSGSGTTAIAAKKMGRKFLCCDNNPDAIGVALNRLIDEGLFWNDVSVISYGFYRIQSHRKSDKTKIVERLIRDELQFEYDNKRVEIIEPFWRRKPKQNQTILLKETDLIVRLLH